MRNLFLFFTLFALEGRLKGPSSEPCIFFFFFGLDELLRKEELSCEEQGVRELLEIII